MTDLLSPPAAPAAAPPSSSQRLPNARPLALFGTLAATWTAASGLVAMIAIAVAGWFAADSGTVGDAIRIGGLAWLVGNGSGLHLAATSITMLPLGAVSVIALLLHRAGRWVGSRAPQSSWRELAVGASALAAGYAVIAVIVSTTTRSSAASTGLSRTLVVTLLLALVFGGSGVVRGAGRLGEAFALLPEEARAAANGGIAGFLTLTIVSGTLLTGSLVSHFSTAVTLAEGMRAGVVGGIVVTLVGLAMVPNAVLFAGAYLVGPGFAVGSGTTVAPGDVSTGPLPGLPLLAALPRSAAPAWLEVFALLVPVVAGAIAGLFAVHRYPVTALQAAAVRGALAGVAAGGTFGLLCVLSAGSAGPGRMQDVGPGPSVLLVCALTSLVAGAAASAGRWWIQANRPRPESVS